MLTYSDWQDISKRIEQATHSAFNATDIQTVSGGCINTAYTIQGNNKRYFIKLNHARFIHMFEAESSGLAEILQTNTIKVPQPILSGIINEYAFLVLEHIDLTPTNQHSDIQLGQQLAALHKKPQPFFGWHLDNTIGLTTQINKSKEHWPSFWQTNRLNVQLTLAKNNGANSKLIETGEELSNALPLFFTSYSPAPSLLHGDLWSGNTSMTKQGLAIIYDPACYYGDRETDIAMTELFGGFSPHFYAAYNEYYPLDSAYPTRKILYNLYHILNHFNLFGTSYQQQAQNMIDSLLSEIY